MTEAPRGSGSAGDPALLEMRGITKRFPGVLANDHVDFDVAPGEIHALFGENGAGKSTLMRVLFGLYRPDEGEIRLRGNPLVITSPGRGDPARYRHDPPALHAGADAHGGGERRAGPEVLARTADRPRPGFRLASASCRGRTGSR